jgi:hypothetical protein
MGDLTKDTISWLADCRKWADNSSWTNNRFGVQGDQIQSSLVTILKNSAWKSYGLRAHSGIHNDNFRVQLSPTLWINFEPDLLRYIYVLTVLCICSSCI